VTDAESKAASVLLREHRMQFKARRLKKEAKAAERKVAQKKRIVEEEIRKRQRAKVTIQSYFTTTRNPDNRGNLDQLQGCENDPQLRRQHRGRRRQRDRNGIAANGGRKDDAAATNLLDLSVSSLASVDAATTGQQSVLPEGDTEVELSIAPVLSVSSDSS
jgi:hypothetical protein